MLQEYGGYIELDTYQGKEYHEKALALNCSRNCLWYLIKARKIKKLFVPYFVCNSVTGVCEKTHVPVEFYPIDNSLKPVFHQVPKKDEWLYLVNFYGQMSNEDILLYKKRYGNIIVDQVQAFFQSPVPNVDTIYNCRKFFGVADGAYLYTDAEELQDLETDISFERMHFLLGRFEQGANVFYPEYVKNNALFQTESIKKMSKLTHNLLRALDYEVIKKKREQNFAYLQEHLKSYNQLKLMTPAGAFMYPLWIKNGAEVRKKLQQEKIYIPTLWPNVLQDCSEDSLEYQLAENILPLPVDQRYNKEDMNYIIDRMKAYI